MVKNLLFVLFFSCSAILSAQQTIQLVNRSGDIINDDTVTFIHPINLDDSTLELFFKHDHFFDIFNNTANDTMSIDLIREEIQIIDGTKDTHCWGTQCFGSKVAGTEPYWKSNDPVLTFPSDTSGGIGASVYIFHNEKFGTAIYKYTFTDDNDRSGNNTASIYVKWILTNVTSIEENELKNKFSIYPNPVEGQTTINFEKALNYKNQRVEIYNILGEKVSETILNAGVQKININVNNLESGVYFVNILAEGVRVGSKKMIVK